MFPFAIETIAYNENTMITGVVVYEPFCTHVGLGKVYWEYTVHLMIVHTRYLNRVSPECVCVRESVYKPIITDRLGAQSGCNG